ncbi:MAG: hypothetical protein ACLQVY_09165 [Limisphaerales bacterium]
MTFEVIAVLDIGSLSAARCTYENKSDIGTKHEFDCSGAFDRNQINSLAKRVFGLAKRWLF